MFTPKWKKDAKLLVKGARKFVNYKRDVLKPERVAEIESRREDLLAAVKAGDREKAAEASKQLRATCENSLPREKPQGWFEENVEVMFVAIVIALGLRAYYLQPFRIPTGSMQPTLNGIVGTPMAKEEWPSFPVRMVEKVLRGRSYVYVVNDRDRRLAVSPQGGPQIRDFQQFHFFSRSEIGFMDSPPLRLPAPANPVSDIGLTRAIQTAIANRGVLPAGTVVAEGIIDTGDLVLVDKFSYHFRRPKRGEVFVFDTIDIQGIQEHSGPQGGGSHYIKRLSGVPGDTLSIRTPELLIDGEVAREPGIQRVIQGQPPFPPGHPGYVPAAPGPRNSYLASPADTLTLRLDAPHGQREYAALGDNTVNSLDSRYWGTVKEFNLVGPALFALWPVTTGHWGFIR
jgi:signal peptidase I